MAAKSNSNELKITRVYDAPVKAVWEAWTDPKQVGHWWGPRGFTLTTHSHDLRTGGSWHYTMHGPDGTDYENTTKYLEVEKHSRLVYDHGGHASRPPLFRVTVNFADSAGKTRMEMTMRLPTPEAAAETEKFIKKAGGHATWDRLAEYLDKQSTGKDRFVINRSFAAPIETMFEMWTNPEHMARWTPPTGFDMKFLRAEIKPGGHSFYMMSGNNIQMYGRADYISIERPHHLKYTQKFCDKDGNTSRHPLAPVWPETMLTTVLLSEEGPDRTRVTVTWEVHGPATPAELEAFIKARAGMTQGWTGSFDKLDEYLGKQQ